MNNKNSPLKQHASKLHIWSEISVIEHHETVKKKFKKHLHNDLVLIVCKLIVHTMLTSFSISLSVPHSATINNLSLTQFAPSAYSQCGPEASQWRGRKDGERRAGMSQLLQMRRVKVTARWKPEIKQKYMHKKKKEKKKMSEKDMKRY